MTAAREFSTTFEVDDCDLAGTLDSGQAFRWQLRDGGWEGVIAGRWVRLESPHGDRTRILARTAAEPGNWGWLRHYLGLDDDLVAIVATFPPDDALQAAVRACRGLRLLRQEPWECLASFILSSTKQIVQIRGIVEALCRRFGTPVTVPPGRPPAWSFPSAATLAGRTEAELRECRMGFRAKYLLVTAQRVAAGEVRLAELPKLTLPAARERLMELPGVGRKIADCALLFSGGFVRAFPVDVWILRALRELYFPRRRPRPARLLAFAETHFGPYGGYAQQYLFHHIRTRAGRVRPGPVAVNPGRA